MRRADLTLLGLHLSSCLASLHNDTTPGSDLHVFVTRPEIRPPKLQITYSEPEAVSPGYFFVAPYYDLSPITISNEFVPFQVGPCIYDSDGELIWSGAEFLENRNIFDFRVQELNGVPVLTFILADGRGQNNLGPQPTGVILDSSYDVVRNLSLGSDQYRWDLHEFHIVGNSSITTMEKVTEVDISQLQLRAQKGKVWQYGFQESDVNTGEITRVWDGLDNGLSVTESKIDPPREWKISARLWSGAWDCFHTNSVDKDEHGDYLLSMRYTSTIYKVSGKDNSIIWRLGGKQSDFVQDFNFSSQHYARFYDYKDGATIISMLDNASDEANRQPNTSETSSIKIISIDENANPKTAKLLTELKRPDGKMTMKRGSAQSLPNKGWFAGWSDDGYVNEFSPDGRNVLEAKFTSGRFDSYRAYKFEFVGKPKDPPLLKTFAHGPNSTNLVDMTTVFYVSWNGATEVKSWDFYVTNNPSEPGKRIGSIAKSGFETSFLSKDFWAYAYVEGRDKSGEVLGKSELVAIVLPNQLEQDFTVEKLAIDAGQLQSSTDPENPAPYLVVELPTSKKSKILYVALAIVNTAFTMVGIFFTARSLFRKCRSLRSRRRFSEDFALQGEAMLKHYKSSQDDLTDEEGEDDDSRTSLHGPS